MMGLRSVDDDDDYHDHSEPRSTPKLSLSKLPCKPKHPIQIMLTPPLHPSLSIPFHWEEAPGKPRLSADEAATTRAGRCLDLPPRLSLDDGDEVAMMPSPAMVLGVARSMSLACTFSFRKGPPKKKKKKKGGCGSFGRSRRWKSWGSFKFREEEEKMSSGGGGGGSFDFSQSLGEIFKREKNAKSSRFSRRVGSFFDLSTINSNLLDIYARFKQAIPWRRTKSN